MLSFAREMGASACVSVSSDLAVLTQATPLTVAKEFAASGMAGKAVTSDLQAQFDSAREFWPLFLGQVNGSLGETSVLAVMVGGIYLCIRRTASWEIPAGVMLGSLLSIALADWAELTPFTAMGHLASGSLLFGAFFIATDPVTSPLTAKGKFVFGLGIGILVLVIRLFSGYPEGVMFAVLLMNAAVPLVNRWTIPRPLGGPKPDKRRGPTMIEGRKRISYVRQAWLVIMLALLYGGALAGVQTTLGPKIAENKKNETYNVIPDLVGDADKTRTEELVVQGKNGKESRVYKAVAADGVHKGWVLPGSGQGFSNRIELLIGLDVQLSTITGLYVLDEKETPGLGDAIASASFCRQFLGKLTEEPLRVTKTDPQAACEILALTGATISSESVSAIVNDTIANLKEPIRQRDLAGDGVTTSAVRGLNTRDSNVD